MKSFQAEAVISRWPVAGRKLRVFLLTSSVLFALVGAASLWLAPNGSERGIIAALATFLAMASISGRFLLARYPHPRLGLCNLVTLFRAALTALLAVPLMSPGILVHADRMAWTVFGIALLAFALDGIDGWLARRSGLSSAFGARFDMEVDAVLALLLSVLALQNGKAGLWVLILGLARYAFVLAGQVLPWLNAPLPERFRRKTVCVVQIAVLTAMVAPIVVPPVSAGLAATACLLVLWSFSVDIVDLAHRR